jgi:DNA-binding ferritin-like protein
MEQNFKIANLYIASLKAMALIHQNSHWISKGDDFYGNHLLFERLYDSALENLDLAAEKFIGVYGEECLDYKLQNVLLNKVMLKYNNLAGDPLEMSLAIEKDFLKLNQDAYSALDKDNKLSLGLDDMLASIASKREESIYLLNQAIKT